MLDKVKGMMGNVRMPTEYDSIELWLRNMAFQQFWHQIKPHKQPFMRQHVLFRNKDKSHPFNRWFREAEGMELDDFLDMSLAMFCWIAGDGSKRIFRKQSFGVLRSKYGDDKIESYLDVLSKTVFQLRKEFQGEKKKPYHFRVYERPAFSRVPFLRDPLSQDCVLVSKSALLHSLDNKVYETLRSHNPSEFGIKFGPVFESYLKGILDQSDVAFDSENVISKVCPSLNADFVLFHNDATIYIDAKGVEMPYYGQVGIDPKIIADKIDHTIVKGIKQCMSTKSAYCMRDERLIAKRAFAIIVTYKEMYLGGGHAFFNYMGDELYAKICTESGDGCEIAREDIFFIDVEEFERLLEMSSLGEIDLNEFLGSVSEASKSFQTSKWTMAQYLDTYENKKEVERGEVGGLAKSFNDEVEKILAYISAK